MEVMAEIYRALHTIGFEWKYKQTDWEALLAQRDPAAAQSDSRRVRKEEEERQKKLTDLFFIECRGVIDNVLVHLLPVLCCSVLTCIQIRFDLQLYTQDSNEDSYLVDFRMIGYRRTRVDTGSTLSTPAIGASEEGGISDNDGRSRAESTSTMADNEREKIRAAIYTKTAFAGGIVSSPMLFFEMACRCVIFARLLGHHSRRYRLIIELASPRDG